MTKQDLIETIKLYKVRMEYATTRKHRIWWANRIKQLQAELAKTCDDGTKTGHCYV